ncbi:Hypothetical protein CINCED_3A001459 [Cinara cedri]|uniref:Uncharacterized protein n=1 Tax=Cinara cedri TaxID=506608 RepID=A0A5E4NG93_9HEMI|nr:Hypothetical protein CINCED_3A001459 [Cinara cedri]
MPKIKSTLINTISNWIAPYNENKKAFSSDVKVIYCLVCNKSVSTEKNIYEITVAKQVSFVFYAHATRLAIANLLIGELDGTSSKSYLVARKELESTNYKPTCQFINFSLKIFPGIV